MKTLTSRSNPTVKKIRALYQRKHRDSEGLFIIEGIHHVGEAAQSGADLVYLCYAPDSLKSQFALQLIADQDAKGVSCFQLPEDLFAYLAEKENPQGILAVARQKWLPLEAIAPDAYPWLVALVAPQDPGNIGTILRTIDAVGASGLLLLDSSADPYHPGTVRASMGALFWYPLIKTTFTTFSRWAQQHRYTVYGTSAHGSLDYRDISAYQKPAVLLMGSEREGLTPEQATFCQFLVSIPMQGRVTSLNLAVATGIMLYAMQEGFMPAQ